MPALDRDGDVHVLDLGDGENRFDPAWVAAVGTLLDQVEAANGPRALAVRGSGRFWSNGLDLGWFAAHPDGADDFLRESQRLFARVLVMPVPTVAAVTGHAFGAGAMLAVAHDVAVMRRDRGYWCCPEVGLGLVFTPGMTALLRARLTARTAHEAMTTARRYTADDAATAGIVDRAADADRTVEVAVARAAELAPTAGPTLGAVKLRLYAPTVALLRDGPAEFPRA